MCVQFCCNFSSTLLVKAEKRKDSILAEARWALFFTRFNFSPSYQQETLNLLLSPGSLQCTRIKQRTQTLSFLRPAW